MDMSRTGSHVPKVQLALPGGGAQIVTMLAAGEHIQRLIRQRQIQVTRISGASAGAIVGALIAADIDIPKMRVKLRSIAPKRIRSVFPNLTSQKSFLRALGGRPLWGADDIRRFLSDTFDRPASGSGRVEAEFRDLIATTGIELSVVASDANTGEPRVYGHASDRLVRALMDSCALPVFLRTHSRRKDDTLILDGGLVDNLPFARLLAEQDKHGPVVAIVLRGPKRSFAPTGLLELLGRTLDTAIGSHFGRARQSLPPESILEIETPVDSLKPLEGFDPGLDSPYDSARRQAEAFFSRFLSSPTARAARAVEVTQWSRASEEILLLAGDAYRGQHASQVFRHHRAAVLLSLSAAPTGEPVLHGATIQYRLEFAPEKAPLYAHAVALLPNAAPRSGQGAPPLERSYSVVTESGEQVPTIALPALTRDATPARQLVLSFTPPLEPGTQDSYHLRFTDIAGVYLGSLYERGHAEFGTKFPRASGNVTQVCLVAHVPSILPGARMTKALDGFATPSAAGRPMSEDELISNGLTAPPDHYAVGWIGADVPPGMLFTCRLELPIH